MSNFLQEVGSKIRAYRKKVDLTQEQLGHKLDVDASYISKIERAETNPTLEMVINIARALRISPHLLFIPSDIPDATGPPNRKSEKEKLVEGIKFRLDEFSTHELKVIYQIIKSIESLVK